MENALRRFKRKVQSEDIIKEIKKHSYYMKPGERRRAKEALSRKRLRKKQRREQDEAIHPVVSFSINAQACGGSAAVVRRAFLAFCGI